MVQAQRKESRSPLVSGAITTSLLFTLALQSAIPPFATDMYSPAFPEITEDLSTTSTLVGLTLTAFFVGFGLGQVVGGSVSDQIGRRKPMITGGIIALLGSLVCAFSPNITILLIGRFLQGFGGGSASAVGRAILVDIARGNLLARVMSLLQALLGLAPMVAPIVGALVMTYLPWRTIFWFLAAFTLLMTLSAWKWAPESLPVEMRQHGGLSRFVRGVTSVVRIRLFVGFMLTSVMSSFSMFGYIANASYVLQDGMGLSPIVFSWIFAGNALLATLFSLVNIRLIGRFKPNRLVFFGLCLSAVGIVILIFSVFLWSLPLIPTCVGFSILTSASAFIFGNSAALALSEAREYAGTASAVQGLIQSFANGIAAPLATSGGADARPMVFVMIFGAVGAWIAFWFIARAGRNIGPRNLPDS